MNHDSATKEPRGKPENFVGKPRSQLTTHWNFFFTLNPVSILSIIVA